jgi:hypothetical protein
MDRNDARRAWGLEDDASEEEVMRAYRARAAPFKRKLLQAVSAREKNAFRDALRTLVIQRDVALDREPRSDWQGSGLGVSSRELLEELAAIGSREPDLAGACHLLGVSAASSVELVEENYQLRLRALRRVFARADGEQEMLRIRDAARVLEAVRRLVLDAARSAALPEEAADAGVSLSESTLTVDAGEDSAIGVRSEGDVLFDADKDDESDDLLEGLR